MTPRISFYLKNSRTKKFSVLFSRIIYHGFQLKVYLPLRVNPILRDKKKQILKDKDLKYRDETAFIIEQINENLNQYSKKVPNYILEYAKENYNIPPTPDKLKGYIESYLRNRGYMTKEKYNLFTYFQKIIKDSENRHKAAYQRSYHLDYLSWHYQIIQDDL